MRVARSTYPRSRFSSRAVAAVGIVAALMLSGCAGGVASLVAVSPSPSEIPNCAAVESQTDEWSTVDGTTATCLTMVPLGSVTDDLGSYTRSKFEAPDVSVVKNSGVSQADLESAFEFYANFVSTEVMDSIALDNPSQWEKWKTEVAPQYIASGYLEQILSAGDDGANNINASDIIMTNRATKGTASEYMPVLLRDGGPRVFNKEIFSIKAQPADGGIYIESVVAGVLIMDEVDAANHLNIFAGQGFFNDLPNFMDGKTHVAKITGAIGITLVKEGNSWKIAGFNNVYTMKSGGMDENATPEILALRK